MTIRRWATTSLAMLATGLLLLALAPARADVAAALHDPQLLVDTRGPDHLLVLVAWPLATACWAWGTVGLLLTVASSGTGLTGRVARTLLAVVLPAGARRAAALAVGLSLSVPLASVVTTGPAATTVVPAAADTGVPAPVPDWPAPPAPAPADEGTHVVVRGDCLWDIATTWLADRHPGTAPGADDVAAAVGAWWRANAEVIGPDPDLVLPGQVLRAPAAP